MWTYITDGINNVLYVLHSEVVYIVNTQNRTVFKQTSTDFNITPSEIIIYNFDSTVIAQTTEVPGFEAVPIPVMNLLMKYGRNFIVSVTQFPLECFLVLHDI